jgi:Fe-S-cluster containining protein
MLPEMTLVEALAAIQRLVDMAPAMRRRLMKIIVGYFFLNPVEITSCPFLDGQDCLIYQDRFLGCRAYGLWSRGYYEKLAARSREAKRYLQKQWENLGVSLPQKVIDFQVPYCLYVETDGHAVTDDEMLLYASDRIETLSRHFSQWHQSFRQRYFSDLSFLLASLVFGVTEVVQMKFAMVSDIVTTGNRAILDRMVGELPDLCAELTY